MSKLSPEVKQKVAAAREAGAAAFRAGLQCAPCLDRVVMSLIPTSTAVGAPGTTEILKAWHNGWVVESLKD